MSVGVRGIHPGVSSCAAGYDSMCLLMSGAYIQVCHHVLPGMIVCVCWCQDNPVFIPAMYGLSSNIMFGIICLSPKIHSSSSSFGFSNQEPSHTLESNTSSSRIPTVLQLNLKITQLHWCITTYLRKILKPNVAVTDQGYRGLSPLYHGMYH